MAMQRVCKVCGKPSTKNNTSKKGVTYYRAYCAACHKQLRKYGVIYSAYKKEVCEKCGFKPEHSCQLDVDHIDGDKTNNSISNLQTLCANCHRLKTFLAKDWQS